MFRMMLIAGCGGFIGTCGRFLIGKLLDGICHGSFPLATLIVNLAGCFLIGLFSGMAEKGNFLSSAESILLITGFCGGFTTFSTFSNDMIRLINKGEWIPFMFYLLISVIVGIIFVLIGRMVWK